MSETDPLAELTWRKSSFSGGSNGGGGGDCVEAALLPDGGIAFRDSKNPQAGVLVFAGASAVSWLGRVKSGAYGVCDG
ncbi:DUF397 domain-containing protein [Streptomyces hebeiensis]